MKIVSRGNTISTTEYLEKKLRAQRRRLMLFGVLFIALLVLLVMGSRLEKLRLTGITVSGAEATSPDAVTTIAKEDLSGYYLWLVPKNNTFIYPKQKIVDDLAKQFPRFNAINLSVSGFKTLNIVVSERTPFALYCVETVCYFLDQSGFIFDTAPAFTDGVYFVYKSDEALENPLGRALLSPEKFKPLSQFIERVRQLGLKPLSLEMSTLEYKLLLSNGGSVLWNRNGDLTHLLSNLESFLSSPTIRAQADFFTKIKELDLRTEDKVFYKFQ